jgi:hypothetical protein
MSIKNRDVIVTIDKTVEKVYVKKIFLGKGVILEKLNQQKQENGIRLR